MHTSRPLVEAAAVFYGVAFQYHGKMGVGFIIVGMIKNKKFLLAYKLIFGLLGLSALATEIVVLVNRGSFVAANFFSFFTVESNLFAAVLLFLSAVAVATKRHIPHLGVLRGAATLYMVTTGIVFSVLLSGLDSDVLTAVPWDNTVLHYIMPIALLVDWLIDPPTARIAFKTALLWLAYPLCYVVYCLVRGSAVGWYPYPFLSPAHHGYMGVAITSVGIAAVVVILSWLLVRLARVRAS